MPHGLVNFTAVPKAHFYFCGMDIDIHAGGVHLQIQDVDGLSLAVQYIFISTARTMRDDLVTNKAAVDIRKLLIGTCTRCIRGAGATPHMHRT